MLTAPPEETVFIRKDFRNVFFLRGNGFTKFAKRRNFFIFGLQFMCACARSS